MFLPTIATELSASFATIKPEEISDAIYNGQGSEPMLEAGTKWCDLAEELGQAATTIQWVNGQLQGAWQGESANWMAETAVQHRTWLWVAYQRAKLTAKAARGIADAFDRVHKNVVPPEDIAANRAKLRDAKNEIVINAPKIAALEEEYQAFWAQNTKAMDAYAREVRAQLSRVIPFGEAPQIVAPSSD
ncbi:PPE family protein [Mycobacterium haemophilum]|uniref:PPE family protein n=1 Tax=Mycobacterium haemophilum TaxID=29311 RepID=UPI0006D5C1F6|nr:PPE family protein [Mycobacterium haemophilum]MCV7340954.1 PPE family protein [Mycobacterium haemophilum DSM 44634]